MKLQIVNPLEDPAWDDKVLALPQATAFYSRAWAQVLLQTYGFSPCYFVALDGGRISVLLPMMEVNSLFTGRRGVALPFTDYLPMIGSPSDAAACFDQVKAHGIRRGWRYAEIKGKCDLIPQAVPAVTFWGHRLDVTRTTDQLFASCSSPVRRAIRKAERQGVQVEFTGSMGALKEFYALHSLTRRRHGLPPQPWSFFASIYEHMLAKNRGLIAMARVGGQAIAGAVFFHFGKNVIYKFAASDPSHQGLRPNNLVLWEAIKRFSSNGFEILDLGKTSLGNPGLRNFKLGFGPNEYPIDYLRFDLGKGRFVQCPDSTVSPITRVFKLMPCILLRMVGHVLYRHVA